MKRYYSLYQDSDKNEADLYIYGDIMSYPWMEEDVSSYNLSRELQELGDVDTINVYINSYGGEVKEGLAIYNALKRHKANVRTIADGFACSIASVIFAAGDERVMSDTSLLMIHNAWTVVGGDSNDLRKQADDLEKITQASINSYLSVSNLEEDELKEMMSEETWLDGQEAKELGFATEIIEIDERQVATQSIRNSLLGKISSETQIAQKLHAETKLDEDDIDKIVSRTIQGMKKELTEEDSNKLNLEKNKPVNMLRAFLNYKEE